MDRQLERARKLAATLKRLLDNTAVTLRAERIGEMIRGEHGVVVAAEALERLGGGGGS